MCIAFFPSIELCESSFGSNDSYCQCCLTLIFELLSASNARSYVNGDLLGIIHIFSVLRLLQRLHRSCSRMLSHVWTVVSCELFTLSVFIGCPTCSIPTLSHVWWCLNGDLLQIIQMFSLYSLPRSVYRSGSFTPHDVWTDIYFK